MYRYDTTYSHSGIYHTSSTYYTTSVAVVTASRGRLLLWYVCTGQGVARVRVVSLLSTPGYGHSVFCTVFFKVHVRVICFQINQNRRWIFMMKAAAAA